MCRDFGYRTSLLGYSTYVYIILEHNSPRLDATVMIGYANSEFCLDKISAFRSEQHANLWFRTSPDFHMRDLIPDYEDLWDVTREKVRGVGRTKITVFETEKFRLQQIEQSNYRVAVIVPTYNVEDYIIETLVSLKIQSCTSLQIIVVDDHSTDSTAEKVLEYMNEASESLSIVFAQLPGNIGNPGVTRNFGLFNLLGNRIEYIAFMDGDDVYADGEALTSLANALDVNGSVAAAYGDYDWITELGAPLARPNGIKKLRRGNWKWRKSKVLNWDNLAAGRLGTFHLQNLMVRKGAPFIPYSPRGEDAAYYALLFTECAKANLDLEKGVLQIPNLIAHYRKRNVSVSQQKSYIRPNPPEKVAKQEQSTSIPAYYFLACIPERYRTANNISKWTVRRLMKLFLRDLRTKGLGGAMVHLENARCDSNVRKTDLVFIPVFELVSDVSLFDAVRKELADKLSKLISG